MLSSSSSSLGGVAVSLESKPRILRRVLLKTTGIPCAHRAEDTRRHKDCPMDREENLRQLIPLHLLERKGHLPDPPSSSLPLLIESQFGK